MRKPKPKAFMLRILKVGDNKKGAKYLYVQPMMVSEQEQKKKQAEKDLLNLLDKEA